MAVSEYLDRLAKGIHTRYAGAHEFSDEVMDAFFHVPRHRYVSRFRHSGSDAWHFVDAGNLDDHLGALYADHPLVLHGTEQDFGKIDQGAQVSTISQPSLVLWLLDHLDLEPDHRVYELGTGSGWNAALMGHMVGSGGQVVTTENIGEVATMGQQHLQEHGPSNVEALTIDGASDLAVQGLFDRAIFTAAAFDLPRVFHQRIKPGGRLVLVLQAPSGTDVLLVLDKEDTHFRLVESMFCGFVPMTGAQQPPQRVVDLDACLSAMAISSTPVEQRRFYWGSGTTAHFMWATAGLRSFLSLHDDDYVSVRTPQTRDCFGWRDPSQGSLAVATPGRLTSYGGVSAADQLINQLRRWVDVGMPTLPSLDLRVYPAGQAPEPLDGAWVWTRGQSVFVWTTPNNHPT